MAFYHIIFSWVLSFKIMHKLPRKFVISGVVIIGLGFLVAWSWTSNDFSNPNCKFSQNAAWISVDWTSKPIDESAIEQLTTDVNRRKIRYLYPYTTYIKQDDSFSKSYDYATDFVKTFRQFDKDTRLLAWIGIPLLNNRSIGIKGWVDLSNPDTRHKIVEFIGELLSRSDFDGIHINAETVQNNDTGFLSLLEEIRQKIGPDKIISIAGSHWMPDSLNMLPVIKDFRWTSAYYREVSNKVNQIATMTYDSYLPHAILYRLWVREQVKGISSSLEGSGVELLIGISVSRESTPSHQVYSENLQSGLAGLCAGISERKIAQGVAIYADWEFSPSDGQVWQQWQQ